MALPALHYRDGGTDKVFTAPTVIIGDVVGVDLDVVTIAMRGKETKLYVDDLQVVLGDPDMTLGILLDAAKHHDRVRVALTPNGITYDNPPQLKRYRAKATTES